MKERLKMYKMEWGIWDPDKEFELNNDDEIKRQARRKFEDFIADKKPEDWKDLLI